MKKNTTNVYLYKSQLQKQLKTYFNSLTHLKVKYKPESLCVCVCVYVCLCVCVPVCVSCFHIVYMYDLYCNFWKIEVIFIEYGTDFNSFALLLTTYNR
jgi:hypothetical protein